MGFIKAFAGALGGTFADQWKDFYAPLTGVSDTAGVFRGEHSGRGGRSANYKGNENVITNGTKVIVPEGTALITTKEGAITNIITEAGGYEYRSDDPNAKSIFAGDGAFDSLIKSTWEKFKFGGAPASSELLFYVNLKEIPNNRFGTQSVIYWDDAFLRTQVGAVVRGTYTLRIVDPILFIKNFVPSKYLTRGAKVFDFADMDNDAGEELFSEVVGCLSSAFSNYTNDPERKNRMSKIQGDQIGFAKALSFAVEDAYQWRSKRGLEIVKTSIIAIEYDEDTKKLLSDVKKADALSGGRGNSFFKQAAARGMESAGENGSGADMAFMGMGMNAAINTNEATSKQDEDYDKSSTEKLIEMKKLLDAGVITEEEFKKVKFDILGF